MRITNYDEYPIKHCTRYYGWLPQSKAFKKQIKKKSPKYFTLCAQEALDVFMLELEKILLRDKNKRLPNVFICERIQQIAINIYQLVRPPLKEAIIIGPLERILTFEDNEHTRNRLPNEYDRNRHIREMLRIKGLSQRLKSYFPFDIINFDTNGNLLNRDGESNRLLYQSFEKIFELQQSIDTFLLFVTTPITHIHPEFQSQFKSDFEFNVSTYPKINDTLLSSVSTTSYDGIIDENKRIAIGFTKSVVMSVARRKGWNCEHQGIYIYKRSGGVTMLNCVVKLYKSQTDTDNNAYVKDVVKVIKKMPVYYSEANDEVIGHFEKVKEYREKVRKEYT